MKMQITFRGGAQILVDVESFEVGRGKVTGEIQSLKWETPASWTSKLNTLGDLSEIVAIVAISDQVSDSPSPSEEERP